MRGGVSRDRTLEGRRGGRSRSLPSGAAFGARGGTGTGTGAPVPAPTPTRDTGTMVSPGPHCSAFAFAFPGGSPGSDMGPAGLGSPRCWCHSRWLLGLSLPKGGTRPPGVVGGRARATSRVLTPRVAVSPCLLWPRIACACPVPILRWPRSHVPMVSCPRGPCVPPSLCQCPPSALVLIFRFCPEGGSFLMVPRVTIVPVILMSPGPHRAHPRGSCVPKFPQSPFLMVSSVSLPVPVASPCPHSTDIPMSICPHSPPSPQRPFSQCSHSVSPCTHGVATLSPRVPRRGWRGASARPRRWRS